MNDVELTALTALVTTERIELMETRLNSLVEPLGKQTFEDPDDRDTKAALRAELEQRGIVGTGKSTPEPAAPASEELPLLDAVHARCKVAVVKRLPCYLKDGIQALTEAAQCRGCALHVKELAELEALLNVVQPIPAPGTSLDGHELDLTKVGTAPPELVAAALDELDAAKNAPPVLAFEPEHLCVAIKAVQVAIANITLAEDIAAEELLDKGLNLALKILQEKPVQPVMQLYEARNGNVGCSYVRAYVWCKVGEQPVVAHGVFAADDPKRVTVRLLMSSQDKPFCTKSSDEGWEVEQ